MKKASDILLIIGAVFGILCAVGCLIGGIVCFVLSSPAYTQMFIDAANAGEIHSDVPGATPEQIAELMQWGLRAGGIGCIIGLLFEVAVVVLAFFAKAKQTMGLYIASLVLGVLSGSLLILLGSIFGIVGVNEQPQQA